MPLSGRKEVDKERTAKSQEQELKRARGAISCAECRRLKLKCDKTVPCSSCKRRGCASICPNGSLTTGQGTRFILADTDRLHRKIAEMSDRIRQLEDGLAILQSSVTREPHPLLAQDLLRIKSGLELHSAAEGILAAGGEPEPEEETSTYIDAFGTLAVRDDGAATFYGRSAGSESLLIDEKPHLSISTLSRPSAGLPDLPAEINRLASSFPHGPPEFPVIDLQEIIQSYLPPWPRAQQLRELYLEQAPWFFGAVTRRQLYEEVFPLFYEEAAAEAQARVAAGFVGSSDAFKLPISGATLASSHELALMLVVFCFGALTDPELPPAPHNVEAERYYQLTRASLSLEPVMDRPPSVTTVQVLSLMGIYQGMVADENSIESTWALMGLASKLAQSTGLHRDASRFKLSAAETQKRRALFWELFITDCWQALATGRLPTFELPFVDTELPADPDETLADDGTPQPSFPAWKARWGKECVSAVVMGTLTAHPPKYSLILELDRRLRDMALPKYALGPPPENAGLGQTMSHYMPINYLHLTLLYVHRCFFANALNDFPVDPMRSQYAPSFLAGYRSASALLATIREQFARFPMQIARFWVLWTHGFSACVMMGSVVTRGGTTKTAQAALGELRVACDLFEKAAQMGGRAAKFVPILRKLHEKAQAAYFQGLQPLRRDIFSSRPNEHEQDELSIFSGRTARTVATKSNRPPRISPSVSASSVSNSVAPSDHSSPSGSQQGSDPAGRSSQSPASDAFPGLDSSFRTAVHPHLVAELRSFEGQLDAQITQNGLYTHTQVTQYAEQQYAPQHAQHDPQAATWYQPEMAPPDVQHASVSPPIQHGTQETYTIDYSHSQQSHSLPQPQPQPQSRVHQRMQEHPRSNRNSLHHAGVVPQQQQPVSSVPHPHDIPVYGGAYSKASDAFQYQEHAYVHTAPNTSTSSSSQHDFTTYHSHSVPEQRPEMWAVNAQYHDGGAEAGAYATPSVHGYHSGQVADEVLQSHGHGHGHYQQHGQHTSAVQAPLQHQSTGNAHQYAGHGHGHGQQQYMHDQQPHVQDPQYGYVQGQAHQGYQQMVSPPAQQAPMVQQPHAMHGEYSLQESWTSFMQQELPVPPGGHVRR